VTTVKFYENDYSSTLFPMQTNRVMVQNHGNEISDYIYQKILNPASPGDSFLPQQRVYATKPFGHLRRTVKLDPVAEYFIYDLAYRNRTQFRKPVSDVRASFGYRFENGSQIPISSAYRDFKSKVAECLLKYKIHIKFDIASYFNSLYHHDLSHWFSAKNDISDIDKSAFGQFFREINGGRSIDFLPHGIYPTKMLGNDFLKFIDLSGQLKSAAILRFMDDFYIFDDSEKTVLQDFTRIQQLLGNVGLNVNPSKTSYNLANSDVAMVVTEIKKSLYEVIEIEVPISGLSGLGFEQVELEIENNLDDDQINTLLGFLKSDDLEESDADLILNVLRSHSNSVLEHLPLLLSKFPNISKHIYSLSQNITDKEGLSEVFYQYLNTSDSFLEFQLFWIATIAEECLTKTARYGQILLRIYELAGDQKIVRAKILEIPEQGYGLKEMRAENLKTGASDWLSWASAVGTRSLKADERNYALGYFSKGSPLNFLIASCIQNLK
jgi:hypothetical protein